LHRVKEGGQATAAELREFLQTFRGKSPQEALGLVAQSGLAQGVVISSLGTLVLLVVFTAVPYAMRPAIAQTSASQAAPAAGPAKPAATDAAAAPATAALPGAPPNAEQALEKIGETETKAADPKKNPLDQLDNLLDEAK
jgi:hypothetical protein